MKNKRINRRKFLIQSLESAAGLGVLASCDKRSIVEPNVRQPAAPAGLSFNLSTTDSGAVDSVLLSWDKTITDITGAKLWNSIQAYNVYRDDSTSPIAQVSNARYADTSKLALGSNYTYWVRAVDSSTVVGPMSAPLQVSIQKPSYVYVVKNASAVLKNGSAYTYDANVIRNKMLDPAITQMQFENGAISVNNSSSTVSAWESLFPGLSATSLIGIKINTLGGGNVSTKPAVITAIVNSLKAMLGGTFNEHNIIVFDDRIPMTGLMVNAGFTPIGVNGVVDDGVHHRVACIKVNTSFPNKPNTSSPSDAANLWMNETITVNGAAQKVSRIVEEVDYIINVPVLKNHSMSGITFSLKNLYGLVDAPENLHGPISIMGSPYIPALYNAVVGGKRIQDKIRLIVGDALFASCSSGAEGAPDAQPNTIAVCGPFDQTHGPDPVAIDTWALRTINSYRPDSKKISWSRSTNPAQPDARHIWDASQPPYNLGSTNCVVKEVAVA
jgi:hypothetical protein